MYNSAEHFQISEEEDRAIQYKQHNITKWQHMMERHLSMKRRKSCCVLYWSREGGTAENTEYVQCNILKALHGQSNICSGHKPLGTSAVAVTVMHPINWSAPHY